MSYTNIKVFCRFRPRNELEINEEKGILCKNSSQNVINYDNNTVVIDQNQFNFDYVFRENSTQENVFNTAALPVIEDMLRGYNCTIFVYGQTSSGKTFSMTGNRQNPGLTPRLVKKIFDHIYTSVEDVEFTVCISYVEIYLEKIRDLLNPDSNNLKLREGGYREGVWIQGVTEQYASCYEDVLEFMRMGNSNRSVGETKMNQRSSRSHSVFMLTLTQHNIIDDSRIISKLVLVDLAGSEKVDKTGATGLLLKQAQYTNKSLTYLGMVIKALTENSRHIPYRDSKLTRILTDSLGGNSKTCLIVTCSPSVYNITETISTLRFGTRVKTIKNRPRPNVEKSVDEYKRLLEDAYKRIDELKIKGVCTGKENKQDELVQNYEEKIKQQRGELNDMKNKMFKMEQEIQEIKDKFQEKIAEKENEIETLVNEYNTKLSQKEREIKDKIAEIYNLRQKLLIKSNEILSNSDNSSSSGSDNSSVENNGGGPSKQYLQNMLESRSQMVSVLEVALRNVEETLKSQRNDYNFQIRTLKNQLNNLRDSFHNPIVTKTARNIIVPVRIKNTQKTEGNIYNSKEYPIV